MSAVAAKLADISAQTERLVKAGNEAIRKRMTKKGGLKLPELLEARRWEYLIPDGMFAVQAAYDRILIAQISSAPRETFVEGGTLIMPATTQARVTEEASRGIVVSAGLVALDNLRSNGIDVGHIIRFIRNAPWRMEVDNVEGHVIHALVMRDGDVIASEDLATALRKGECKAKLLRNADGTEQHVFVDKRGKQWKPTTPWIQDDL